MPQLAGAGGRFWANYIPLRAPEQGRVCRIWPHRCAGPLVYRGVPPSRHFWPV